jgi:transposase
MISSASALPDDTELLKQIIVDLQSRYDKETGLLLEQIRLLRAQLYGRKSEKGFEGSQAQPLPLFDMPEPEVSVPGEKIEVPAHTRKKSGRKPLPEGLPRVEVVHDLAAEEKICSCGSELSRIGEEVSEQLDIVPAKIQVIRNIRPKYACRQCEGVEDEGPTVKIAPPPQIIPKSIVTPSLLAHVLTGKFVDAMPFYRQEKQFSRLGIEISRTSMCSWAMKAAETCTALFNLLQDEVLSGCLINIDDNGAGSCRTRPRSNHKIIYVDLSKRGSRKIRVDLSVSSNAFLGCRGRIPAWIQRVCADRWL